MKEVVRNRRIQELNACINTVSQHLQNMERLRQEGHYISLSQTRVWETIKRGIEEKVDLERENDTLAAHFDLLARQAGMGP